MTVYADSLFLMNFLSEYALLILTEKIARVRAKKTRKTAAALFGAAVSTAVFCGQIPIPHGLIGIINAFLIVCAAYLKNIRAVIRAYPAFLLISFIYSGAVSTFADNAVTYNGITYLKISIAFFALIFSCTYLFIIAAARILKPTGKRIYKITVSKNKRSVCANALFDSGNLLTDGGKGVIIVEWDMVKPLFNTENFEELYELDGIKILPFGSLGGCSTVLVVRADFVCAEEKIFSDVPLGIINQKISQTGTYSALMGKQYF